MDSILSENPGKSLDELVNTRKINNDQKAQALKKPSLLSSLEQYEDQLSQYQKIEKEHLSALSSQKETLSKSHSEELEKVKEAAATEAKTSAENSAKDDLLILSKFLRAAAARRQDAESMDTDESKAFEGALLLVYGGDAAAVGAMQKVVKGEDEQLTDVNGATVEYTCELTLLLSIWDPADWYQKMHKSKKQPFSTRVTKALRKRLNRLLPLLLCPLQHHLLNPLPTLLSPTPV